SVSMVWIEVKANQPTATTRTPAVIIWNRGVSVTYLTRPLVRMMRSRGANNRSFTELIRVLIAAIAIVRRFPRSQRRTTRQLLQLPDPADSPADARPNANAAFLAMLPATS